MNVIQCTCLRYCDMRHKGGCAGVVKPIGLTGPDYDYVHACRAHFEAAKILLCEDVIADDDWNWNVPGPG